VTGSEDPLDYFALAHRFRCFCDRGGRVLLCGASQIEALLFDAAAAELRGHPLMAGVYLFEADRILNRMEAWAERVLGRILPLAPLPPARPLFPFPGELPVQYSPTPLNMRLLRFGGVVNAPRITIINLVLFCWTCGEQIQAPWMELRKFCGEPCEIAFRRAHGDPESYLGPREARRRPKVFPRGIALRPCRARKQTPCRRLSARQYSLIPASWLFTLTAGRGLKGGQMRLNGFGQFWLVMVAAVSLALGAAAWGVVPSRTPQARHLNFAWGESPTSCTGYCIINPDGSYGEGCPTGQGGVDWWACFATKSDHGRPIQAPVLRGPQGEKTRR